MLKVAITAAVGLIFTSNAYALCVTASRANLRKGPGTKFEKTWEVYKYMPFRKLSKKGGWYKVSDVDGDTHWIYGGLVTSKHMCAVVKVGKANLRKGPGTKYPKNPESRTAEKYWSYMVLEVKGSWVHVMDEFDVKSWVHRKLVWIN